MKLRLAIVALICCASAARAEDALKFGLDENGFPPLYFKPSDSERGIFEQVFDEVAKITGDRYIPTFLPNNRKIKAFEDGGIDIEPGVSPEWRKPQAAISRYSAFFADSEEVMLYHEADKKPLAKLSDMKGRILGGIVGFVYPEFQKWIDAGEVKRDDSKDREMMIQKLLKDRVDAIILPKVVAVYWLKNDGKGKGIKIGPVVSKRAIAFRFHVKKKEALERFDKALKQVIDQGKVKEIYAKFR